MIEYADITNFTTWFINEIVTLATNIVNKIDSINIYNTVTLLDFIIAITTLGIFLEIIINAPKGISNEITTRSREKPKKERKKK